jgi:hypothetical protein
MASIRSRYEMEGRWHEDKVLSTGKEGRRGCGQLPEKGGQGCEAPPGKEAGGIWAAIEEEGEQGSESPPAKTAVGAVV